MEKLTLQMLKDMKPGMFAKGETIDSPKGCNMTNSGAKLRWVASRGDIHDWAIYIGPASWNYFTVKDAGDKVMNERNIKALVDCDDDAFLMYRF